MTIRNQLKGQRHKDTQRWKTTNETAPKWVDNKSKSVLTVYYCGREPTQTLDRHQAVVCTRCPSEPLSFAPDEGFLWDYDCFQYWRWSFWLQTILSYLLHLQFGAIPEYHMFDFRQVWLLKLIKISQNSLELQHFNSDASARNESAIQCSKGCQPAPRVQFGNFSLVFLSSQYWVSRSMSITKPALFILEEPFRLFKASVILASFPFSCDLTLDSISMLAISRFRCSFPGLCLWSNAMLCLVQKLRELEVWLLKKNNPQLSLLRSSTSNNMGSTMGWVAAKNCIKIDRKKFVQCSGQEVVYFYLRRQDLNWPMPEHL